MNLASLDLDGVSFEYCEAGEGAPVILLHGAPSDCRMWAPHCAALATQYRVIAYTQRYFGRSPASGSSPPFGVETHAADLLAVIDRLGAGPAHVVAWSYAGHAGLLAAICARSFERSKCPQRSFGERARDRSSASSHARRHAASEARRTRPCRANHLWPVEQPERFVALLRSFLRARGRT